MPRQDNYHECHDVVARKLLDAIATTADAARCAIEYDATSECLRALKKLLDAYDLWELNNHAEALSPAYAAKCILDDPEGDEHFAVTEVVKLICEFTMEH